MKKFILLSFLVFLTTFNLKAQDREQKFGFYLLSDPVATFKDGFNYSVGIEYKMTVFYFDAQIFHFPDLRGVDYFDFTATVLGFNHHFTNKLNEDVARVYLGSRLGVIWRGGEPNGTYGAEIGFDWFINEKIGIGFGGSYDYREDLEYWENYVEEKEKWIFSGFGRIIFRF